MWCPSSCAFVKRCRSGCSRDRGDRLAVAVEIAEVPARDPLDLSEDVLEAFAGGDVVDIDGRSLLSLPREDVERDPCDRGT